MRRILCVLVLFAAGCSNGADPAPTVTTASSPTTTSIPTRTTASTSSEPTPPTTTAIVTTSTSAVVPADAPSQSPADAARDGVVPEIAELTPQRRIQPLVSIEAAEGTWVVSALTDGVINETLGADGCAIGDATGLYGIDFVCSVEYGEFVLLDSRGEVAKAYPMPGVPPTWLHVTDTAVYGGRVGDGGLPDATIVRIDRVDLSATVVVMPAPVDGGDSWLPGWFVAHPDQLDVRLVGQLGSFDGLLIETSWIGPLVVDLQAIDDFIDQFVAAG